MDNGTGTYLHVNDTPLDDDTANLLDDLTGFHPGIDLMVAGARLLAHSVLTRDQTQTILSTLVGGEDADVVRLLGVLVTRMTQVHTNPCLLEMDPEQIQNVAAIGERAAEVLLDSPARRLVPEASIRIDPLSGPQPTDLPF